MDVQDGAEGTLTTTNPALMAGIVPRLTGSAGSGRIRLVELRTACCRPGIVGEMRLEELEVVE